MRTNAQFQKVIAVLLVFLVLIEFTGCYNTRILSVSEISQSDMYLVHYGNSFFPVCNLVLTEGMLTGERVTITNDNIRSFKNHIYLSVGTVIRTENNLISVPAQSVERIEHKEPSSGKTVTAILVPTIILGGLAVVGIFWAFISLMGLFQE